MRANLKILVGVAGLAFMSCAAYAETVTISTYYPSPYGSYQTLETNILQGAAGTGNVSMVPTGGNVGIRNAAAAPGSLLDVGNSALASNAIINVNAAANQQAGINFQSAGANRWSMYRPASSTDLRFNNGASDMVWLTNAGNLGVGTTPGAYKLNVSGASNLQGAVTLTTNNTNAANELQVNCTATGCYAYAVYA